MIHHKAQNTILQPKTATATPSKQAASRQDFRTDFQRFHGHQTLNHPCIQMNESLSNRKSAVSSMNESLSLSAAYGYSTSANICNSFLVCLVF
jgi:hypothetical protein